MSLGLDEEIAQKQFDKFLLMVMKVLSKSQTNFNRLDFKKNNGNYQETTRKTSILRVKKAEGLLEIYSFETFLLP